MAQTSTVNNLGRLIAAATFILFVLSCKTATTKSSPAAIDNAAKQQLKAFENLSTTIALSPGKVSLLTFSYFGPFEREALHCNDSQVPYSFSKDDSRAVAYVALPYEHTPAAAFTCVFSFTNKGTEHSYTLSNFHHVPVEYPHEKLTVAEKRIKLSEENQQRAAREKQLLNEVFEKSASEILFAEPFSLPLTSKITSDYGLRRLFNGMQKSVHFGTDFRASIGTPINAANKGRVAFVGDLFYTGNIVVVDHGLGIFTCYMHLSQSLVQIGDPVTKETVLGLSGQTGRVSGPHLHLGVKLNGEWVDALSLVAASQENYPTKK